MTCDACTHFEATRIPARYNAGCLDCSARSLAHATEALNRAARQK